MYLATFTRLTSFNIDNLTKTYLMVFYSYERERLRKSFALKSWIDLELSETYQQCALPQAYFPSLRVDNRIASLMRGAALLDASIVR